MSVKNTERKRQQMKRLTKKQMWIFAVGQLGWSTLSGIIGAWFVTFYLPTSEDLTSGGAIQYITPGLVIGGFLTVFMCYLIPILMYIKTTGKPMTYWKNLLELIGAIFLCVVGFVGGIVTIIDDAT